MTHRKTSAIGAAAFAACVAGAAASVALANPAGLGNSATYPEIHTLHNRATPPGPLAPRVRIGSAERLRAFAAGWQRVNAAPPFASAGVALLMTNGVVLVHDNANGWYGLTPDNTGNYVNGTWTHLASLPGNYAPLYFASAVLPDGRVIVTGGEYDGSTTEVWSSRGALYSPTRNTWTAIAPPPGWTTIGDAPSAVLANGTYMLGNCCSAAAALLNPATLRWTATGAGKADRNNEEGWTLLPSGALLATDVAAAANAELYDAPTGRWHAAGTLPADLTLGGEIGPQVLLQNGRVFVAGANGATALYDPAHGAWASGPSFPSIAGRQVDVADGPATQLTNGSVLLAASPGLYNQPSYMFSLAPNGGTLTQLSGPPNAANDSSYYYRFLLLPTGQVLVTDFSNDVEIYTPNVTPNVAIAPAITSLATTLSHGAMYRASGVRFNGVSQANAYGDDSQAATNYPLVAITNVATRHVFFARTHGFTSMAVASPALSSTYFDVPGGIERGASRLVVIANGIQSRPVAVTVR